MGHSFNAAVLGFEEQAVTEAFTYVAARSPDQHFAALKSFPTPTFLGLMLQAMSKYGICTCAALQRLWLHLVHLQTIQI